MKPVKYWQCTVRMTTAVMPALCVAGLQFLPLRDGCGHLIHQSGFFVLICKTALKVGRRGGLALQTSVSGENGHVDNGLEAVQNGDHLRDQSDQMSSDDTSQKARQKHFSRQHSIEEHSTSSEVVVVELH